MSPITVYVRPQQTLSRAMDRVSNALEEHCPINFNLCNDQSLADIQVLHIVGDGQDALSRLKTDRYVVIQYCLKAVRDKQGRNEYVTDPHNLFQPLWDKAEMVWSYYDLSPYIENDKFYLSPLGVDEVFKSKSHSLVNVGWKDVGVITTGYVSGPGAEAIEEVAFAAVECGMNALHIGPRPQGMDSFPKSYKSWSNVEDIPDSHLASLYSRAKWVSGLRHIEGFELPVIEGLCCGARPIVFDRADMRRWYNLNAVFVPELHGSELIDHLKGVFSADYNKYRVDQDEAVEVGRKFDWEGIAEGFWNRLAEVVS